MIDHGAVLLACRAHAATLSVATTGSTTLAATATGYTRDAGSFLLLFVVLIPAAAELWLEVWVACAPLA